MFCRRASSRKVDNPVAILKKNANSSSVTTLWQNSANSESLLSEQEGSLLWSRSSKDINSDAIRF